MESNAPPVITPERRKVVDDKVNELVTAFKNSLIELALSDRPFKQQQMAHEINDLQQSILSADVLVEKAGKKLSADTESLLRTAFEQLKKVLGIADTDPEPEKDTDPSKNIINKEEDMTDIEKQALKKSIQDEVMVEVAKAIEVKDAIIKTQGETIATQGATITSQGETISKAQADIAKMVGDQTDAVLLNKVTELGLVGDPVEMVKMLKSAKAVMPETDFENLLKTMAANAAVAANSQFFKESGSGRSGVVGSALAEADIKAEELVKSNPKLTKAAARTEVWKNNPALYEKYKQEQKGGR